MSVIREALWCQRDGDVGDALLVDGDLCRACHISSVHLGDAIVDGVLACIGVGGAGIEVVGAFRGAVLDGSSLRCVHLDAVGRLVVRALIALGRHFHSFGCDVVLLAGCGFRVVVTLTRDGYCILAHIGSALVGECVVLIKLQCGIPVLHAHLGFLALSVIREALWCQCDGGVSNALRFDRHRDGGSLRIVELIKIDGSGHIVNGVLSGNIPLWDVTTEVALST